MEPSALVAELLSGNRRALARALRVVEDRRPGWDEIVAAAWARTGRAHLIGITGAPGSGKSTITNALISAWRAVDRSVAVVAVDPSSPFTGGALMGDRIRMQDHVADPNVFVRSMSSRGRLGGLADATAAATTLFESAGFDPVVIETVGVGQSEVDVIDHADTVVVVLNPGWGDGIQADKAGLLEVGDVFLINKADRPDVADTRRSLQAMLEMSAPTPWEAPILETVATEDTGIEALVDALDRHRRHLKVTPAGIERRRLRVRRLIEGAIAVRLRQRLTAPDLDGVVDEVVARSTDPWSVADRLV